MRSESLIAPNQYEALRPPNLTAYCRFQSGPKPGQRAPDFDLPTTTGDWFRLSDHWGEHPTLIEFASITCPMTAAATPGLSRLYGKFGDDVWFVSVYVREAYPGEVYGCPETYQQKMSHAETWAETDRIPWTVAVDWLKGTTHQAYGSLPNAVYLVDSVGHISYRMPWAGQAGLLRRKIEKLLLHERTSEGPVNLGENHNFLFPIVRGSVEFEGALRRGGRKSIESFKREVGLWLYRWEKLASRVMRCYHSARRRTRR